MNRQLAQRSLMLLGCLALLLGLALPARAQAPFAPIDHFVIIYQENWSFDGLYGLFPGANGIANAGAAATQVDKDGKPYATLPQALDTDVNPAVPDTRLPADLPNAPFDLTPYVPPDQTTGGLVHRFYQQQLQINGGKMDKFVAWGDAGGLTMSHYDAATMPEGRLARSYTLADNFFHAAFGGSFLNHQWLICACTPLYADAPEPMRSQLDANGVLVKDGTVTPDGYVVNTAYPEKGPYPAGTDPAQLVPLQTQPTIGDRLDEKGLSWAWYAGGWNDAVAGKPAADFQFHHQPFAYFANYALGTPGAATHLKDRTQLDVDLANGTLPAVSFVKQIGKLNEHPGYANVTDGQQDTAGIVESIINSPYWLNTAIIITYDENGGRWDHVAPPVVDRWGPGTRVPTIVVSRFAKQSYIDSTVYDTTSILKTIESRWNLQPVAGRDAAVNDMRNAFDFSVQGPAGLPDTGQSGSSWLLWSGALLLLLGIGLRRRSHRAMA